MKKIFLAVMVLFLMTSCWDKVYDEGGGYYDHISLPRFQQILV